MVFHDCLLEGMVLGREGPVQRSPQYRYCTSLISDGGHVGRCVDAFGQAVDNDDPFFTRVLAIEVVVLMALEEALREPTIATLGFGKGKV